MNLSSQKFFNDINYCYRAAMLKKNPFWLLLFYKAVATYCYLVCRTISTAIVIVSYLLKCSTWRIHDIDFTPICNLIYQIFSCQVLKLYCYTLCCCLFVCFSFKYLLAFYLVDTPWTQDVNWRFIRFVLDVLCAFNLRYVSSGTSHSQDKLRFKGLPPLYFLPY